MAEDLIAEGVAVYVFEIAADELRPALRRLLRLSTSIVGLVYDELLKKLHVIHHRIGIEDLSNQQRGSDHDPDRGIGRGVHDARVRNSGGEALLKDWSNHATQ